MLKKNSKSTILKDKSGLTGYVETCLTSMKNDGARLTKTRKAVLGCLEKTTKPLTPSDIMAIINKKSGPNIDLVSVYRILSYLSDLSLVHQVGPDGGYFPCAHTNCGESVHVLLNCSECNSTVEMHVPQNTSSSLVNFIKNNANFVADPHALEVKGQCEHCSNTKIMTYTSKI